jgi:pimeloyl-ACP methyl ester carboxylesterase
VLSPELTATRDNHLASHIEQLVTAIDGIAGDVVLVGHSYGGMLITGAAVARPGRVVRLVYVDALVPADGEGTLAGPKLTEAATANAHAAGDGWLVGAGLLPPSKFVDWEGERLEQFRERLSPQPLQRSSIRSASRRRRPHLPSLYSARNIHSECSSPSGRGVQPFPSARLPRESEPAPVWDAPDEVQVLIKGQEDGCFGLWMMVDGELREVALPGYVREPLEAETLERETWVRIEVGALRRRETTPYR